MTLRIHEKTVPSLVLHDIMKIVFTLFTIISVRYHPARESEIFTRSFFL